MAKRVIQPNDEEIARRAMDISRQISGRVFVSRNGPYLVVGLPQFGRLRQCLAGLSQPPPMSAAPTPVDLGFAPHQITLLNSECLSAWGRALQKWRKILDDYEKPRQKTTERRQKYRLWKAEIEQLSHALERLWQVFRKWEAEERIDEAPYVRVDVAGSGHDTADSFDNPLWNWLERLVIWIAGEPAGRRFHESLGTAEGRRDHFEKQRYFSCALSRLRSLEHRSKAFSDEEIADAVRNVLAEIPEGILAEFGFPIRYRLSKRNLTDIVAACSHVAAKTLQPSLVGSAAALYATDGAETPLPPWLFYSCDRNSIEARLRAFESLYDEHLKTGYEKLLTALRDMPGVSAGSFSIIRQFLVAGVDLGDIAWGLQHLEWSARDLAVKGLSPRPFRDLISALERAGLKCDNLEWQDTDLDDVVARVAERKSTNIVEAFALWLSSLGPGTLDDKLARWAWNCLWQLLTLEGASQSFANALERWARPPMSDTGDPLLAAAPPEARVWLSKLIYYQKLCGRQPALPRSVAKLLGLDNDQERELEYLRKAKDNGRLNESMAARLTALERHDGSIRVASPTRLLKQLQEVCARTALDAVKHLAHREGCRIWEHLCGCPPPLHLTEEEITAIAAWSTGLDERARSCFRELIVAWGLQGMGCRRELSSNRNWVSSASRRMSLDAWFAPEPCAMDIDGLSVTIGPSPDPFRIFLMGHYFGTCLSLDDCNRDSVLANAYDANKSVIFALGPSGQVLARKLVCISSNYKLIGYRTYVVGDKVVAGAIRERLASAIDAFCGRLAQRIGIPLGFTGSPANLSGVFWYDDGIRPWQAGAMRAWATPQIPIAACMKEAGLLPPVADALRKHGRECVNLLAELGIWPPLSSKEDVRLEDRPGLAEESLALLARTTEDRQLARVVFEHATTNGGQLQAAISVALLEKSDDLAEYLFSIGMCNHKTADRALEALRKMGSPKAWQVFMRMVVRGGYEHILWLPLVASDSPSAVSALIHALMTTREWTVCYEQLLLVAEMLSARGFTFPPMAVVQVLASDRYDALERCFLAQWLPQCRDRLKHNIIQKIAGKYDALDSYDARYTAMAAVVVALKNLEAKTEAYLKEAAARDPSALLALSLSDRSRYREFIRKTALAAPLDIATLLALIESEGVDAASKCVVQAAGGFVGLDERLTLARTLYHAFRDLDAGHPVVCLPAAERFGDLLSLLPYVLARLWKWTDSDHPNLPALRAFTASDGFPGFLEATHVDTVGLAAKMASLLRSADDRSAATVREALKALALLHSGPGCRLTDVERVLFLGKLSDHKLWTEPPQSQHSKLAANDTPICAGAWELLLDGEGTPRPVVKWLEFDDYPYSDIRFPLDPRAASHAMRLVASFGPNSEQAKSIEPMTEIERQLLFRHIPAARP